MRAEFFRPGEPETVVGTARWDGRGVAVEAEDPVAREALERIFRPAQVAVDDPALRPAGVHGPAVVEPGDLTWFRSVALVRGEQEGLGVRFASDSPGGWDPAGAYRRLGEWVALREAEAAWAGEGRPYT